MAGGDDGRHERQRRSDGPVRVWFRGTRRGEPARARGPKARSRGAQHGSDARAGPGHGPPRLTSSNLPPPWATEGPIQAEVFVLRMGPAGPELAGPCGPDPWYIEVAQDQDPLEVVGRLAGNLMGEPLLVHSTSW